MPSLSPAPPLFAQVKALIDASRQRLAISVNAELTMLYWQIGKIINNDVLQHNRADYGRQTVATLARQLSAEFGGSFAEKSLRRMMQVAESFPDEQIVVTLSRQLR